MKWFSCIALRWRRSKSKSPEEKERRSTLFHILATELDKLDHFRWIVNQRSELVSFIGATKGRTFSLSR